jgi:hypothetical protein
MVPVPRTADATFPSSETGRSGRSGGGSGPLRRAAARCAQTACRVGARQRYGGIDSPTGRHPSRHPSHSTLSPFRGLLLHANESRLPLPRSLGSKTASAPEPCERNGRSARKRRGRSSRPDAGVGRRTSIVCTHSGDFQLCCGTTHICCRTTHNPCAGNRPTPMKRIIGGLSFEWTKRGNIMGRTSYRWTEHGGRDGTSWRSAKKS